MDLEYKEEKTKIISFLKKHYNNIEWEQKETYFYGRYKNLDVTIYPPSGFIEVGYSHRNKYYCVLTFFKQKYFIFDDKLEKIYNKIDKITNQKKLEKEEALLKKLMCEVNMDDNEKKEKEQKLIDWVESNYKDLTWERIVGSDEFTGFVSHFDSIRLVCQSLNKLHNKYYTFILIDDLEDDFRYSITWERLEYIYCEILDKIRIKENLDQRTRAEKSLPYFLEKLNIK